MIGRSPQGWKGAPAQAAQRLACLLANAKFPVSKILD
jgi:hypothetical protein